MPLIETSYIREQTSIDHDAVTHPDNSHAIDLTTLATHTAFGGGGKCKMTRINSRMFNPNDTIWTVGTNEPTWVDESIENLVWDALFLHLELEHTLRIPEVAVNGSLALGGAFTMDVETDPRWAGQTAVLSLSLGPDPVTSPSAVPFLFFPLDAAGGASIPGAVPNNPVLSGLTFFLEATVILEDEPIPYTSSPYAIATIQ
jgi:hypothetical protein